MSKSEHIVRYSAEEIDGLIARGEDQTDWDRVRTLTPAEIEASVDVEDEGEFDWSKAMPGFPHPKKQLTVRFDGDIIEWFKAQGSGYQSRMNAVLRSYVDAKQRG